MSYSITKEQKENFSAEFDGYQASKFVDTVYQEAINAEKSNWLAQWESDHSVNTSYLDHRIDGLLHQKSSLIQQIEQVRSLGKKVSVSVNIQIA